MRTASSNRFTSFAALFLAAFLFGAGSARAALVTFDLMESNVRTTGWQIVYDNTQVSSVSFTGTLTNVGGVPLQGGLTLTKTFSNLTPTVIQFVEINPATSTNAGLRININETIVNQSGFDWSAFRLDIVDTNAQYDSGSSDHPWFGHIHPNSMTVLPFTQSPSGFKGVSNVFLSGGIFTNGTSSSWTTIAIHQYEVEAERRNFTFIETPIAVPEPSSLFLVSAGILALAFFRRRRS